jgi:hypothetical protein
LKLMTWPPPFGKSVARRRPIPTCARTITARNLFGFSLSSRPMVCAIASENASPVR